MRHRVHPLSPLLKSFATIAAVTAFAVANQWQLAVAVVTQLYDWAWLGLLVGTGAVAIIIGLIAFFSWLSWRYTFYELTDDEVRYGSGWLLRSRRAARLDRVQAVDINQPLLARIFGLAEIVIETAGGSDSHFTIKYLTPPQCEQFRADVLGEVEKLDTELAHSLYDGDSSTAPLDSGAHMSSRMPEAKTIFGPVDVGRLIASVAIGPGLFVGIALILLAVVSALFTDLIVEILSGVTITTLIVIGSFAVGLFGVLNQSWDFTLKVSSESRRLAITAGLLSTRAQTIPIDRIHGFKVVQPLWWRPWRWSRADVSVAGYGLDSAQSNNTLVPVAPAAETDTIVDYLMTEIAGPASTDDLLGSWQTPRTAWWLSPIDWKFQKVQATKRGLLVTKGRFWHTRFMVSWQRIQGHTLTISPLKKAAGVANVRIDMVPGAVTPVATELKLDDAYQLAALIQEHKAV